MSTRIDGTHLWTFSKQQFRHIVLPHPGARSNSPNICSEKSESESSSIPFRRFPGFGITATATRRSPEFVLAECRVKAERRGDCGGVATGVGDLVRWGVGGIDELEGDAVHMREQIVHVGAEHLC